MDGGVSVSRIRLKCREANGGDIRTVIVLPNHDFQSLRKRLSTDYGFEVSLKYEDKDGDLIMLSSQNDFDDLFLGGYETVNVIVSETTSLPNLQQRSNIRGSTPSKNASIFPSSSSSSSSSTSFSSISTAGGNTLAAASAGNSTGLSGIWTAPTPRTERIERIPIYPSASSSSSSSSSSPSVAVAGTASTNPSSSTSLAKNIPMINKLERFPSINDGSGGMQDPGSNSVRWKRGEMLGQGAFGVVYLGLNTDSGELMAVKQMAIDEVSSRELSSLENEIQLLRNLRHQNIVRYIGTEVSSTHLSIFLEYVPGGSLKALIDKFGQFEESVAKSYTRQLLLGLEYLHRNGIAHRDIKGANCLVGNDGVIKLADFGNSKQWRSKPGNGSGQQPSGDIKGTPSWMAPEVIKEQGGIISWKKADVWSLACTTLEMTTGKAPWSQFSNSVTILYHIACQDTLPEYPSFASMELITFLNVCLQRDPSRRPDITSLLLHPFVANVGVGGWNTAAGLGFAQRPSTVSTAPAGEWDSGGSWRNNEGRDKGGGNSTTRSRGVSTSSVEVQEVDNGLIPESTVPINSNNNSSSGSRNTSNSSLNTMSKDSKNLMKMTLPLGEGEIEEEEEGEVARVPLKMYNNGMLGSSDGLSDNESTPSRYREQLQQGSASKSKQQHNYINHANVPALNLQFGNPESVHEALELSGMSRFHDSNTSNTGTDDHDSSVVGDIDQDSSVIGDNDSIGAGSASSLTPRVDPSSSNFLPNLDDRSDVGLGLRFSNHLGDHVGSAGNSNSGNDNGSGVGDGGINDASGSGSNTSSINKNMASMNPLMSTSLKRLKSGKRAKGSPLSATSQSTSTGGGGTAGAGGAGGFGGSGNVTASPSSLVQASATASVALSAANAALAQSPTLLTASPVTTISKRSIRSGKKKQASFSADLSDDNNSETFGPSMVRRKSKVTSARQSRPNVSSLLATSSQLVAGENPNEASNYPQQQGPSMHASYESGAMRTGGRRLESSHARTQRRHSHAVPSTFQNYDSDDYLSMDNGNLHNNIAFQSDRPRENDNGRMPPQQLQLPGLQSSPPTWGSGLSAAMNDNENDIYDDLEGSSIEGDSIMQDSVSMIGGLSLKNPDSLGDDLSPLRGAIGSNNNNNNNNISSTTASSGGGGSVGGGGVGSGGGVYGRMNVRPDLEPLQLKSPRGSNSSSSSSQIRHSLSQFTSADRKGKSGSEDPTSSSSSSLSFAGKRSNIPPKLEPQFVTRIDSNEWEDTLQDRLPLSPSPVPQDMLWTMERMSMEGGGGISVGDYSQTEERAGDMMLSRSLVDGGGKGPSASSWSQLPIQASELPMASNRKTAMTSAGRKHPPKLVLNNSNSNNNNTAQSNGNGGGVGGSGSSNVASSPINKLKANSASRNNMSVNLNLNTSSSTSSLLDSTDVGNSIDSIGILPPATLVSRVKGTNATTPTSAKNTRFFQPSLKKELEDNVAGDPSTSTAASTTFSRPPQSANSVTHGLGANAGNAPLQVRATKSENAHTELQRNRDAFNIPNRERDYCGCYDVTEASEPLYEGEPEKSIAWISPYSLEEHMGAITKLRAPKKTNLLISSSSDGTVRLWGPHEMESRITLDATNFMLSNKSEGSAFNDQRPERKISLGTRKSDTGVSNAAGSVSGGSGGLGNPGNDISLPFDSATTSTKSRGIKVLTTWAEDSCETIWAACSDGAIRVWAGAEGKALRFLKGHDDTVTAMEGVINVGGAVSSASLIATGSADKTVRIWDARAKRGQVFLFRGHADSVLELRWGEGGRAVYSAGKDKAIRIWDTRAGRLRSTLEKHFGAVNSLRVVPESIGRESVSFVTSSSSSSGPNAGMSGSGGGSGGGGPCFVSAGRDSMIHLWSGGGDSIGTQAAHRGSVNYLSEINYNCSYRTSVIGVPLMLSTGADNTVKVWDLRRFKNLWEIPMLPASSHGSVSKMAWAGQGIITASSSGALRLWNLTSIEAGLLGDAMGTSEKGSGMGKKSRQDELQSEWSGRDLASHTQACTDLLSTKSFVASGSKSGQILIWHRN